MGVRWLRCMPHAPHWSADALGGRTGFYKGRTQELSILPPSAFRLPPSAFRIRTHPLQAGVLGLAVLRGWPPICTY